MAYVNKRMSLDAVRRAASPRGPHTLGANTPMIRHSACFAAAILVVSALPTLARAVPFDTSSSATPATVSVGLSGDYLTLSAASAAFSALASVNRPWVLEIQNDITEASNCYFGATFGANGSLTIRPSVGATPIVTFTNSNNPTGYDGHLVVGAKNGTTINAASSPASNARFTINGCATPGGTSRDLTIQAGTPVTSINSGSEVLLNIVANTDQVVVKNAMFGMYDTTGNSAAVALTAVQIAGNNLLPDGTTLENCEITAGGSVLSHGVLLTEVNGGGVSTGVAIENTTIENCDIAGRQHGILMLRTGSTTIEGNTVTVSGSTNSAPTYEGILHQDANETLGFNTIIRRNVVEVTAPSSGSGIVMAPGGSSVGTYVVDNNIVKGITFTGLAAPTAVNYRGIIGTSGTCNYFIEHNSINMANQANISIGSQSQVVGIALTNPIASPRTATVVNNIVRNAQTGFGSTALYYASNLNVTSNRNCLWFTDACGWLGGNRYATLANWQIGGTPPGFFGFDGASQNVDPTATSPAWDANLHFATPTVAGLTTVLSSTFLTDVDGDMRPSSGALPGADHPVPMAGVEEWGAY